MTNLLTSLFKKDHTAIYLYVISESVWCVQTNPSS